MTNNLAGPSTFTHRTPNRSHPVILRQAAASLAKRGQRRIYALRSENHQAKNWNRNWYHFL